jgi:hypothetical protein
MQLSRLAPLVIAGLVIGLVLDAGRPKGLRDSPSSDRTTPPTTEEAIALHTQPRTDTLVAFVSAAPHPPGIGERASAWRLQQRAQSFHCGSTRIDCWGDWLGPNASSLPFPLPPRLDDEMERLLLPPTGGAVRPALGRGVLLTQRAHYDEGAGASARLAVPCESIPTPAMLAPSGRQQQKAGARPHVLVVGHSHSRYIASIWCMMMRGGGDCHLLDQHERNVTRFVPHAALSARTCLLPASVTFLQANFDLRNKLWMLLHPANPDTKDVSAANVNSRYANSTTDFPPFGSTGHWPPVSFSADEVALFDGAFSTLVQTSEAPSRGDIDDDFQIPEESSLEHELVKRLLTRAGPADVLVVSRGSWDLLFLDQDPVVATQQLAAGIRLLASAFPGADIVVHMPHLHVWNPPGVPTTGGKPHGGGRSVGRKGGGHSAASAELRSGWRKRCFAAERQQLYRDVNLCAAFRASLSRPQVPPVRLFDFFDATATPFARQYVDGLGHHYLDVILEEMALQMLAGITQATDSTSGPASKASVWRVVTAAEGTPACHRVAAAARHYRRHGAVEQCSCMLLRRGNSTRVPQAARDGCWAGGSSSFCCRLGRSVPIASRRT